MHRLVEELRAADSSVHQVHVGPQGEGRVCMAQPLGDLLDVRPASNSIDAQVWRKVWKLTHSMPTASRAWFSTRWATLPRTSGVPRLRRKDGRLRPAVGVASVRQQPRRHPRRERGLAPAGLRLQPAAPAAVELLADLDVRALAQLDVRPGQPESLGDPQAAMGEELEEQPPARLAFLALRDRVHQQRQLFPSQRPGARSFLIAAAKRPALRIGRSGGS